MRGEYGLVYRLIRGSSGSPPHAWGIRKELGGNYERDRITPTCVGNTQRGVQESERKKDHPHMRGEYP